MSHLTIAAVALSLAFAPFGVSQAQDSDATAQTSSPTEDAPSSDAPVTPEQALTPADEAFQVKSEAFDGENQKFLTDLQAVIGDSTLDKTAKIARGDELIFAFTPTLEAFSVVLRDYLIERANRPENADQKDTILRASENLPAQLYVAPAHLRDAIRRDVEAQNP